eukprot:TRINITY_DN47154_c0_g1_i1.p1 TRINITY_DN47154_c0_g1~~TRINITY_DN47154_c0_g1_i1.p1  ORF type:complete len:203 (-),score=10.72 TRINITY_DN47154_c0_g1_i1:167-775(-)
MDAAVTFTGTGVTYRDFGGEGEGVQASWQYPWQENQRYGLLVGITHRGNWVQSQCWFSHAGQWKHIATMTTGYQRGIGLVGSFLEQYTHADSTVKREAKYGPAWYGESEGPEYPPSSWTSPEKYGFHAYAGDRELNYNTEAAITQAYPGTTMPGDAMQIAIGGTTNPNNFVNPAGQEFSTTPSSSAPNHLAAFQHQDSPGFW